MVVADGLRCVPGKIGERSCDLGLGPSVCYAGLRHLVSLALHYEHRVTWFCIPSGPALLLVHCSCPVTGQIIIKITCPHSHRGIRKVKYPDQRNCRSSPVAVMMRGPEEHWGRSQPELILTVDPWCLITGSRLALPHHSLSSPLIISLFISFNNLVYSFLPSPWFA